MSDHGSQSVDENDFPIFRDSFPEQVRKELMHDDASAWRAVTGLLLFIISVGVTLALMTVYFVL